MRILDWTPITLTPRKGRLTSVVKQRFIDIIFRQSKETRTQANAKVNRWQRVGNMWSDLITRFGYGSLLFLLREMTDEL